MEYTKNYHLPQWKDIDRILMSDFNQMCWDLEGGLTTIQALAERAQETANSAQAPLETAQAAAEAAQETADTALTTATAAWSAANPFFATYSYVGTGSNDGHTITVGFRPSVVIMSSDEGSRFVSVYPCTKAGVNSSITWNETGFRVGGNTASSNYNNSGERYFYFAIR